MAHSEEEERKRQDEVDRAGGLPAAKHRRQSMERDVQLWRHRHPGQQRERSQDQEYARIGELLERIILAVLGDSRTSSGDNTAPLPEFSPHHAEWTENFRV